MYQRDYQLNISPSIVVILTKNLIKKNRFSFLKNLKSVNSSSFGKFLMNLNVSIRCQSNQSKSYVIWFVVRHFLSNTLAILSQVHTNTHAYMHARIHIFNTNKALLLSNGCFCATH